MTDNTASIKDWARVQELAESGRSPNAVCLLELRARIEALEANTYKWRCDHLRLANTCASLAPDRSKFFTDLMPDEELRTKPPSLKEQALLALSHLVKGAEESMDTTEAAEYIRQALEQLDD